MPRPARTAAIGCGASSVVGFALLALLLMAISSLSFSCSGFLAGPCSSTDHELHLAAKRGDTAEVERVLRDGADPNERDRNGETALNCAASGHHAETAMKLVDLGAKTTTFVAPHRTELVDAAIASDDALLYSELVRRDLATTPATERELVGAVDHNADHMITALVARGAPGDVGLRHAVVTNKVTPVKLLLDVPTPIPASGNETSLLSRAAFNDNAEIVAALLAHGADPNDGGQLNQLDAVLAFSAIDRASPKGPSGTLVGVVYANAKLPGEMPPLVIASARGNRDSVVRLLDAGADPNGAGLGIYTPLYGAVISGDLEVVDTLLQAGAFPTPVVEPGTYTPRQVAQLNGRAEIEHRLAQAEAALGIDTALPAAPAVIAPTPAS